MILADIHQADAIGRYIDRYLEQYRPYQTYWNYEDGCVLTGCADLYEVTGDSRYRDFVLRYLDRVITRDGTITTYPTGKKNIDSFNSGRALLFGWVQTGEERFRKAMDFMAARLREHPRCECGNFWHKEIYPDQIWLDGLYMAQPFRVAYDMRFGGMQEAADTAKQFGNVRKYLFNEEKHLYYHACDMKRSLFWANPETGCSANFWLRSMGWYLMALADCIDWMDERLFEHRRVLIDLYREAIKGIREWADPESGLYYQVIDQRSTAGNYLETSGSAMVIYAMLKGIRLGLLDGEDTLDPALDALNQLTDRKLIAGEDGCLHLEGICKVAGLGPADNPRRDGSVAYYLSEPVTADDAKGVGPYMMAVSEGLRAAGWNSLSQGENA